MKIILISLFTIIPFLLSAQEFSCPAGQADTMKYFVLSAEKRADHFMNGRPNPIYTKLFPDTDVAASGYWFWLKSPKAHGFDVKSFDEKYVYMRSTELVWTNNTTFKRFGHDLPIAARCLTEGEPGPQIKVADTKFQYFSSCRPYKSSHLGTSVNSLDAPERMETGGNIGTVWTRVLHYRYNCDNNFENCKDEEQFFLGNAYGLWQWKHFRNGALVTVSLMNDLQEGKTDATLPCADSYR